MLIEIPRVIYVNSYTEYEKNSLFKLCKKNLPREKKPCYLYEIQMTEEMF